MVDNSSNISLPFFATFLQRFPTWQELRSHLESPAGGGLRIVDDSTKAPYVILRYVKGVSALGCPELGVGLFRSVVWNTETNRPVCMAPPKSKEGLPPLSTKLAATEDFVDGFMMNAFLGADGNLCVATRTQIGGANAFYSSKTFGEMFDEALATSRLKDRVTLQAALAAVGPTAFVSFVVQHPDHRVVAKVLTPALYCVHLGTVEENGTVQLLERPSEWPQGFARLQIPSYAIRQFHTEKEVQDLLRKMAIQAGWRWQGLVFKDGTGARWRLRSPTYSMLRDLRGAEATAVDRFLRLRSQGKVVEYLKHYKEDAAEFWRLEQALRLATNAVFTAYVDVHKAHSVAFKDLPTAYKPAVYRLHVKWLEELRPQKMPVRLQAVIEVVNSLRPFEQRRLLEIPAYETPSATINPSQNPVSQEGQMEQQQEQQPA